MITKTFSPVEQGILDIFDHSHARSWRKQAGRPEISAKHFPIGWIPLRNRDGLQSLVRRGLVSIETLPSRVNPARTATFVVLLANDDREAT